ncbi:MAG: DUF1847 domain-containing protein [Betaproteobacteria bacterium]|nr:DUF1847 domain-containing protein [Betaproteobacteria bacterium]
MKYEDPSCAYCPDTVRACRVGESAERGPGYCPSKVDQDGIDEAAGKYDDAEIRRIAQVSAVVEAEGYCQWTRVQEICEFAKRMGFKKIGIATCISFVDHAKVLSGILESHGFEVASVACKHGGIAKEELGLKDEEKIRPGTYESMCNPVGQAALLKRAGCELNVVLGLCVGHDSLFFKHAAGLSTVLVAKDRVLAHNPIGALNLADTYYSKLWGPDRPAKPPKIPAEGRRKG